MNTFIIQLPRQLITAASRTQQLLRSIHEDGTHSQKQRCVRPSAARATCQGDGDVDALAGRRRYLATTTVVLLLSPQQQQGSKQPIPMQAAIQHGIVSLHK